MTDDLAVRNVVQIATMPSGPVSPSALYALCDDGTIWVRDFYTPWQKVEAVPQSREES